MRSPTLLLSHEERQALLALSRSPPQTRGTALRARIVLRCAAGQTNSAVASEFGVSMHTVGKWRHRYLQSGLAGLKDQPRSGKPRRFEWDALAVLIESKLASSTPDGGRWTVRKMASAVGIPPATVARIWRYARAQKHCSADDALPSNEAPSRGSQPAPMASMEHPEPSLLVQTTTAAPRR